MIHSILEWIGAFATAGFWLAAVALILFLAAASMSFWRIGPTEVGLVRKRFSFRKLASGNPIAFRGEAGYQAQLLTPGIRFKLWPLYDVTRHPMVQIPAGQIGVVIAQVGTQLPIGAKSAVYKPEFGNFENLEVFVSGEGQKGVQRPVLSPGTVAPIHPVGFLVITKDVVYGVPVSEELQAVAKGSKSGHLNCGAFGLRPEQLEVTQIRPRAEQGGRPVDMIGIVTALEGLPTLKGAIASRIGGFDDIVELQQAGSADGALVEAVLANSNGSHNNYQNFQAFIDSGGRIGLQHDVLLYGAYTLNPFLIAVEMVPMLVVEQGQVAVVKAYVGLTGEDTSGTDFKFGALVHPGHRGIWQEPLRTGKYAINPRCYSTVMVPTSILTLNWADAVSKAHDLDKDLRQIEAKSKDTFVFKIDLQVQIHVPDTEAPRVISIVGTMQNLVSEVLQAAVGNHFRDKLQSMPAIQFIEKRQEVQTQAEEHIRGKLKDYMVETRGVYIQDVVFPPELVKVLTAREIANQQVATFESEQKAQESRLNMEAAKGNAEMQAQLAKSKVGVDIATNEASAVKAKADGEAYQLEKVGVASAVGPRENGLAVAVGLKAQQEAVGPQFAALVAVAKALAEGKQPFMPVNLALTGGADGVGGSFAALVPLAMQALQQHTAASAGEEKQAA